MIDPITEYILEEKELDEAIYIPIPVTPGMDKVMVAVGAGLLGIGIILSAATEISIKAKKKKFPACKKYSVTETPGHFNLCITKEMITLAKQEIIALNKLKSLCSKTKNPNKCASKIDEKITKVKKRIAKLHKKIDRLQKWANVEIKQESSIGSIIVKHDTAIASVALAAVIIKMSYEIYKHYVSAGAKACHDKQGRDKDKCIKEFRKKGLKAQIGLLKKASSKCDTKKDAEKCKSKIKHHIEKIQSKIEKR